MIACPTADISGGLPREPATETEMPFERKKALKRNVANRPLHVVLGAFFSIFIRMLPTGSEIKS